MAYTTINKSTDYFNTKLYTGTGANLAVTGVGHQPDFTWVKRRDVVSGHKLTDAVRGAGYVISTVGPDAQFAQTGISSFDTDGFTVGTASADFNTSGGTYTSWNWKAGTTSGLSGGTITPSSYTFNTTSGFSILKYTGTGSNATIPHGLGAAPKMIIEKQIDSGSNEWGVYHASQGAGKYCKLDTTEAFSSATSVWQGVEPTSSVFSVGTSSLANANGGTHIAYCFAEKIGYSKFGSYKGNGNADGTFIYTGFKPAFILIKTTDLAGNNWQIYDNKREGYNSSNDLFRANGTDAEGNGTDPIDIYSNGFKMRNTAGSANQNNGTYIYMALGQSLVGSNNVPCTAR